MPGEILLKSSTAAGRAMNGLEIEASCRNERGGKGLPSTREGKRTRSGKKNISLVHRQETEGEMG